MFWCVMSGNPRHKMKKTILAAFALVACAVALSSCHTVGGVGRDVEAVGNDITGAAQATSRSL